MIDSRDLIDRHIRTSTCHCRFGDNISCQKLFTKANLCLLNCAFASVTVHLTVKIVILYPQNEFKWLTLKLYFFSCKWTYLKLLKILWEHLGSLSEILEWLLWITGQKLWFYLLVSKNTIGKCSRWWACFGIPHGARFR